MTDRDQQLAEHLRFFQELGVEGVRREPIWCARPAAPAADRAAEPPPDVAGPRAPERPRDAAGPGAPERPREAHGAHPAEPEPRHVVETAPSLFEPTVPVAANAPPDEQLRQVRAEIGDCTRCRLHAGRTHLVFGVGSPTADLMFVGEAPGRDEDLSGEPFVGRAGQLLTKIIEAIGLTRPEVYIANVIKCRPPQNRNPERDEVDTCEPFLFAQVDAIKPRVIVALGSFAVKALLHDDKIPISRARGRVYTYRGATLIPTFHPAFLLRSPDRKRDVWEDMKKVRAILRGDDR